MGSVVQPQQQQQQKQCPVCYDDVQDDWPTLPCGHVCCRPCLKQWFLTEEKTGQAAPTCPLETCRKAVNDATAVLGRAFVPAGSNNKKRKRDNKDDADDAAMDPSTKAWLEANTLECGGCQGRITKSSGCDKLQCICGYRICWKCRKVGAQCGCNPGHGFVDNVTGLPSWSRAATVANESQLQNMKQFLEDRRKERPRNTLLDMFGSSGELRSQRRSRVFGPLSSGGGDPWSPSRMAAKMRHMYPTAAAAVPAKRPRPSPNSLFGMTTSWRAASGPLPFPFWGATPTAASTPPSTTSSASSRSTDSSNTRDPPSSSFASFPAARPFLSSMMMPSTATPSQPQHPPNDLLRPTLFRDLPDIFGSGGSTADAELRRALHLSLMEPTNTTATTTTALAATRHAAAAAFPLVVPPRATTTYGSTAAHPIRVDDDDEEEERINISTATSRKLVPPAAPQKKRPAALRRRSRNQEYEDDMEKAIRLSLLESSGSSSGGTALNPVCVDEEDLIDGNSEEKKDDEMDSKPAAVITRQVTAETTLGIEARTTTTSEATAVEKA